MIITKENELVDVLQNLQQNEKITLIGFNDFGFIQSLQTRFCDFEIKKNYSQMFIYLIHKPKHKRKYLKKSLENKDIIILKGWHNIDIDKINFKKYVSNGIIYKKSVFNSYDSRPLKDIKILYHDSIIYSNLK